jgi:hypothetical protein
MKNKRKTLSLFEKIFPAGQVPQGFATVIPFSLLFLISAVYFYFYGNGIFFFQENNLLFIYSTDYVRNFALKPGGLLVYAGNFLTQFYFSALSGSLIISFLLLMLCIVSRRFIRLFPAIRSFSLFFTLLPSCVLLLLQARYDFNLYQILGFLLVLTWFLISISPSKTSFRIVLIGLFPLGYYLIGSFSIVYLGLYLTYNVIFGKGYQRYILPSLQILYAVLTYILFRNVLFLQPVYSLMAYPLFVNDTARLTMFLKLISGFIISFPLVVKAAGLFTINKNVERLVPLSTILTIIPLTIFLLFKNYDSAIANVMELEKMMVNQDWDSIIKQQERSQSANVVAQYYYNLALSEKGQLCSRMFFSRQDFGPMSLTLPRDDDQTYRALYFYYCIGLVSEAHHLAYELMVQHGYRPENIKLLIKTELINGNYKIAERYINVLKKTFHYNSWAEKYGKMLYNPDLINSDPELGGKIRLLPKKDFFVVTDDEQNVELFLKVNPDNKKAYEYKMARLLLEKDLTEVGAEVKNLKDLGYAQIPRHIEEAVVALVNVTGEFPPLGGLLISRDTDQRFIHYFSVINSFKGNKSLIDKGTKITEKNTFWYYLQFSVVKSDFFKKEPVDNSIY